MKISVVICTYNRCESLKKTLESLSNQGFDSCFDYEILIVDNNSKDRTKEIVETFNVGAKNIIRYIFESRQGLSIARNRGIREAQGNIIAFTDDDCIVSENWLQEINNIFSDGVCQGAGGKIIALWGDVMPPDWYGKKGKYEIKGGIVEYDKGSKDFIYKKEAISLPIGANMVFQKSCFDKHGYFKEDLGLVGKKLLMGEDREFCLRLIKQSECIKYCSNLIVWHPVERHRLTEKFFLQWHYWYGYSTSIFKEEDSSKKILKVRRYLFRQVVVNLFFWLFTILFLGNKTKKLYYKINLNYALGAIKGDLSLK